MTRLTGQAAVYARVSTEEQAERGTSLDVQVAECMKRAEALGLTDIRTYVDAGISGTELDRPQLGALRQDILNGRIGHVFCYDPDRLSRNLGHLLFLMDEFAKAGAEVEFTNFDLTPTADGRLLFAVRGAIAEFETHKIRQRMTAGKLARAREGQPVGGGHQIYGYRYDKALKRFDLEPVEAPIVALIFRLAEEMGTWEIAKTLNARSVPAKRGGAWSQASVLGILRNPTYLGAMSQMKGIGHVPVPPLLEPEAFERVQERLRQRQNRPPGPARHPYLLRGFLLCGLCGRRMGGGYGHPTRHAYTARYACAGKRQRPACPSPYLRADIADRATWGAVVNHLLHPSALPKAAELVRQELARQAIRPGTSRHDDPEAQLEALDLRRRRLLATYLDGLLDERLFRTELGRLDQARVHIEEEWSQRKGRGAEDLGSWCLRQTAAFARLMTAAPSLADRRLLLSSLGARVILKTGGALTLEVHLAFGEPG